MDPNANPPGQPDIPQPIQPTVKVSVSGKRPATSTSTASAVERTQTGINAIGDTTTGTDGLVGRSRVLRNRDARLAARHKEFELSTRSTSSVVAEANHATANANARANQRISFSSNASGKRGKCALAQGANARRLDLDRYVDFERLARELAAAEHQNY